MSKTDISIVIRTKDEEDWIAPCIKSIKSQKINKRFEIILVDNSSKDATVKIARQLGIKKIVKIKKFFPGKAINLGIEKALGEKIVLLSAHCIPYDENWLRKLDNSLNSKKLAGVYARQIPLPFTSPDDARDLLITFGLEKKIQKKDTMFHNAHSIIWKEIWKKFPFDNEVKNVEDRVWADQVINSGYNLKYDPNPIVFHYHGLHQHGEQTSFRSLNVSKIVKSYGAKGLEDYPDALLPEKKIAPILVPLNKEIKGSKLESFNNYLFNIRSHNNESIFIYSFQKFKDLPKNTFVLKRSVSVKEDIKVMLKDALLKIEKKLDTVIDGISVCDFRYENPIFDAPKQCKELMFLQNFKFVCFAFEDSGAHWALENNKLRPLTFFDKNRNKSIYRLAFGQGSTFRASSIRLGNLVPSNSSIIKSNDISILLRN